MVRQRTPTTKKGQQGEDLACRFLAGRGFKILARNCRNRFGEIDIVAEESGDLVFVEVRSLTSVSRHLPEETISTKKQQRLSRAALAYIQEKGLDHRPARFDVVSVETAGSIPTVRHLPDAFEIWES